MRIDVLATAGSLATLLLPARFLYMTSLLRPLSVTLLMLAVACGGEPSSGDPTKVTYSPALGVNLAEMERTETGLYKQDLEEGTGTEATAGRYVTAHYSGWLPNGLLFDSSHRRNEPFSFTLGAGQVIKGWDEGIAGMKVGGKRRLVIPAELGYGSQPRGSIPANSVLVFDVELLDVR
jgi:FKBP-type peptidyl-prolyl cis-trans isomerase FkpA